MRSEEWVWSEECVWSGCGVRSEEWLWSEELLWSVEWVWSEEWVCCEGERGGDGVGCEGMDARAVGGEGGGGTVVEERVGAEGLEDQLERISGCTYRCTCIPD